MNFEPQKFFIGLIDFFSVLLPGALLTYVLKDDIGPHIIGNDYAGLAGPQAWIVFVVSAYLLGHFIFLLGASLDDVLYDPIRKATTGEQVKRLSEGGDLSPRFERWLAARFFKKEADQAVRQAIAIKEHYLDPLEAASAINAFQWCKARLTLENPAAMATVQRFEADSKFFRSLLIVLCVLFPLGMIQNRPAITVVSVALLVLAFLRYVDQRVKATTQAYWYVLTLESQRAGGFRQEMAKAPAPSHAGGVVVRRSGAQVLYLLVQAKRAPHEWVLPKGHIESTENPRETAIREVREETGVWAGITSELSEISFPVNGAPIKVRFYLMHYLEEGKPSDENRKRDWLPYDAAVKRAFHDQSKDLLQLANDKLRPRE